MYYSTAAAANIGSVPSVWGANGQSMSSIGGGSSVSYSFNGLRDVVAASASAQAGPFLSNSVLKLNSDSQSFTAGPDSLVSSLAIAGYTDRIYVSNNSHVGEPLRLLFELTGTTNLVTSVGPVGSYGAAEVDLAWSGSFETLGDLMGTSGIVASAFVVNNNDGLSHSGFSGFQSGSNGFGTSFRGQFSVETAFDQQSASYGYSLTGRVFSSVYNGTAQMNVGNSVTLIAVYDSANQAIPFSDLTFASGAILTAVPEPSAGMLLGLTVAFLTCKRVPRRRSGIGQ